MVVKSFETVRRVVFGTGSIETLADEIRRVKGTKVLVVTDPGIKSAGLVDIVTGVLERAKLPHKVFAEVEPDPRIEVALASYEAAKAYGPDVIVGLGGGSSLDISKVTSVLLTNEGPIEKYFGMEMVPRAGRPADPHPHDRRHRQRDDLHLCPLGHPEQRQEGHRERAHVRPGRAARPADDRRHAAQGDRDDRHGRAGARDRILRRRARLGVHRHPQPAGDPPGRGQPAPGLCQRGEPRGPGEHAARLLHRRHGLLQHPERARPRAGARDRGPAPPAARSP